MSKKIFALCSVALLSLSLAACTDKEEPVVEVVDPVVEVTETGEHEHEDGEKHEHEDGEEDTHDSEEATPEPTKDAESDKVSVEPTGNVVEVTVNASNFEFDVKEIKAKVGDTVKLSVVNAAGGHGIAFSGIDATANGGETIEFVVTEEGEFQYFCSVPCGVGHDKMTGTLTVEA